MDWLRISPAQVTLPGYAAVCDLCSLTIYRLSLGEAQTAAVAHLEEKHGTWVKWRIGAN